MRGLIVDCRTGRIEAVDDGKPFPQYPPPAEPIKIDLTELKKLLDYAKAQGWI